MLQKTKLCSIWSFTCLLLRLLFLQKKMVLNSTMTNDRDEDTFHLNKIQRISLPSLLIQKSGAKHFSIMMNQQNGLGAKT